MPRPIPDPPTRTRIVRNIRIQVITGGILAALADITPALVTPVLASAVEAFLLTAAMALIFVAGVNTERAVS